MPVMRCRPFTRGLTALFFASALAAGACSESTSLTSPDNSTGHLPTAKLVQPTVTGISPTSGGDAGGTVVTITGTGFVGVTGVSIGGVPVANGSVPNNTTIIVTTAPGTPGTGDVVVSVGILSATLPAAFTYLEKIDTVMTFRVYNHTAGLMGTFTQTAQSGSTVTLPIATIGEPPPESGATRLRAIASAIPVDNVDPYRIIVREAGQNGLVGPLVIVSGSGTATFTAPYVAQKTYDVFLLNTGDGADYTPVDLALLGFDRSVTFQRGADAGGATGPDEPIDNLVRETARALSYPWMTYGKVARVSQGGQIYITYIQPNADTCATYTRSKGMMYFNPARCAAVPVDLRGAMLENGFEMLTGKADIFGADSAGVVNWSTFRLTPIGRDLLAYVFLKDARTW